jgi:hypothetical protein
MTSSSSPSRKVPVSPPPNPPDSPPGAAPPRWVFRLNSANNSIDPFSPVQALSKIACNRLQKELAEWQLNPPAGFKHKVSDNLQRCRLSHRILPPCNSSLVAFAFFFRIYVVFFSFALLPSSRWMGSTIQEPSSFVDICSWYLGLFFDLSRSLVDLNYLIDRIILSG